MVVGGHSEAGQSRVSVDTAAIDRDTEQVADSPSSSASGAWSFLSSWLSELASLSAGLNSPAAKADAENVSSASAKPSLAQEDRSGPTATLALSNRLSRVVRQEGIQTGNPAACEVIPPHKGSVALTGPVRQLQDTANPVKSSESVHPAESPASAHSATSKRNAKLESASNSATDGNLAPALMEPSTVSPVANAVEASRSSQTRFFAGSKTPSAEDSRNPFDSGLSAPASHAHPANAVRAPATGRDTSIGEEPDEAKAALLSDEAVTQSSERTRPRLEEPEPAQMLPGGLAEPQLGVQGLETAAGLDASGGIGQVAEAARSQPDQLSVALVAAGGTGSAGGGRSSAQAVPRPVRGQSSAESSEFENRNLKAQSTAHNLDGTIVVRDLAGAGAASGNAPGSTGASTGCVAGKASSETFAALDAGTAPGAPTWIHAGLQRAEAGFQDPALGWVGVRADLSAGGVHASLVPGSSDAAQTLGDHLAGLSSYLAGQHMPVETVTLASPEGKWAGPVGDQGASQGMNHGAGEGGFSEPQSNPPPVSPSAVPASSSEDSIQTLLTDAEAPIAGQRGASISLMA
jgi:hypothetical protein